MAAWIFQGNPSSYPVDKVLTHAQTTRERTIQWRVSQRHYRDDIVPGDRAFIWRADGKKSGTGGVVAVGVITASPREIADELSRWLIQPKARVALMVTIEMNEVRLTPECGMLLRTDLLELLTYAEQRDMLIFRMRNLTNYKLTPTQGDRLDRLWRTNRPTSAT
jgi:hypothetical protein